MHRSKLNKAKSDFINQIKKNFTLIQCIHKAKNYFSKDQVYLIYELSFLKNFLAWEWFIEKAFLLFMMGNETKKGYKPETYVYPRNEKHAYELIRAGREYADWTSPDIIIKKASLFFKNGSPFKNSIELIKQDIQDIKTLRNAIVHISHDSQEKFYSLLRNKIGYVKTNITPGKFLSEFIKDNDLTYITYYSDLLMSISDKIVM